MARTRIWTLIALLLAITISIAAQQKPKEKEKAAAEKITNGPVVEGVGHNWAVIAWTTNTGGSTLVKYGADPNHLTQTGEAPYADNEKTASQNHRVHLKNLKPGTTYYFTVVSGQGEGSGTQAQSSVGQFTTKK